ncbi:MULTISPECIES: NUDIX hydrolase [Streptomyces]|uniref:NUDIX hydrolase n=1 Tax=Streptomyces doudnae TaxID=3075536 RepID=A0ABD5EYL0_9ACTN|nr:MULTISPECIES: NUDIX hydrolase [unclassified Streptomyces]MDT0438472.1 NUDIX hydrolase [Streptomyces sp. DSM 41981]SCE31627.1 ADP-ribose pyrophosphatase YjhB, NUDIX family [Streptomyces sp. SolWspMP-5a-2]
MTMPSQRWLPREEWIKTQPQALLASCVVLRDPRGRMLLLRYGPGQPASGTWWPPGGMLDPGEDPWTAARREMREETGLTLGPDPLLIGIDHRADVDGTGPVLDCFFDGGTVGEQAPVRLSGEHDRYAFVDPDELSGLPLTGDARTLRALYAAALGGGVACLREGLPHRAAGVGG